MDETQRLLDLAETCLNLAEARLTALLAQYPDPGSEEAQEAVSPVAGCLSSSDSSGNILGPLTA